MKVSTVVWIAGFISALLLAIQVLVSTKITIYSSTDIGLISKLPITFWIGLFLLCFLLYTSRKSKNRIILTVILISFFLVALPVLIKENKADGLGISYYFSSQASNILSQGHLKLGNLDPWDLKNWPGFFFASAIIESITGISASALADYFPLFTITLLGLMVFSVLRLKLDRTYSALGTLWFVASFWTGQHYYSPQSFAYMMYFGILLLFARLYFVKNKSMAIQISIALLFAASVITHLLTSFFIFASIVAIIILHIILRQRSKLPSFFSLKIILLLASIFFVYQMIAIPNVFSTITTTLAQQISAHDTSFVSLTQGRSFGSTPLKFEVTGIYTITIINAIFAVLAITVSAFAIIRKKEMKGELFWVAWIITAAGLGLTIKYGGEALNRALMFMLIPVSYFAMRFLSRKPKILVAILIVLVFLYIPARYCAENYSFAPTSEIDAVTFYTYHAATNAPLFYEDLIPVGAPFGPQLSSMQYTLSHVSGTSLLPSSAQVNYVIGQCSFVISSRMQDNFYKFFYGLDPLQNVSWNDKFSTLYDNGYFCIYDQVKPLDINQ